MARNALLRTCKACGESVSRHAKFCTDCGHPPPLYMFYDFFYSMVRLLFISALIFLLAEISGYLDLIKAHMDELYPPKTTPTAQEFNQRHSDSIPWRWLK